MLSASEPLFHGCLQNNVISSFELSGHTCSNYVHPGILFLESMNIHSRKQKK